VLQAYAFLIVCAAFRVDVPWRGWLSALRAVLLAGFMLGVVGLLRSVHIRQLENFAGTMNFVIFPMFFRVLGALPLWKVQESGGRSGASGWRSSATTRSVGWWAGRRAQPRPPGDAGFAGRGVKDWTASPDGWRRWPGR
jgi:hypothetical protein